MQKSLNLHTILNNYEVHAYLKTADDNFAAIGYKEHGFRHAQFTAKFAGMILDTLKYNAKDSELARISGYLHDIGNAISQKDHAQNGAILAWEILSKTQMSKKEIFTVMGAIGSHEDKIMDPPSIVAAAVILGDKTDVHHTRVRQKGKELLDEHARVNYACQRSFLNVNNRTKTISLELSISSKICSVMDYFEIFLERTKFCQKSAKALGCTFELFINNDRLL